MSTYIALLRGINVGGKKIVPMEDLRQLFVSLNFSNVKTYIQSGNVLFDSAREDKQVITQMIEDALRKTFSFAVSVVLRTREEWVEVIANNPFEEEDTALVHVTFLSQAPSEAQKEALEALQTDDDKCVVLNKEVYLLCKNKYSNSIFSNTFIEKKFKLVGTTRNITTVGKLLSL